MNASKLLSLVVRGKTKRRRLALQDASVRYCNVKKARPFGLKI